MRAVRPSRLAHGVLSDRTTRINFVDGAIEEWSLGPTLISVWMVAAWVASTLRPSSLAPMGLTRDGEGVRLGQLGADDTTHQPGLPDSTTVTDWVSVTFDVASDVSAPRVP
jgi:hypothetical protein